MSVGKKVAEWAIPWVALKARNSASSKAAMKEALTVGLWDAGRVDRTVLLVQMLVASMGMTMAAKMDACWAGLTVAPMEASTAVHSAARSAVHWAASMGMMSAAPMDDR